MKKALKIFLFPTIAILSIIVACNKSDTVTTVDDAVDEVLFNIQERGGMGRFGCYELVFPVTIVLPDSSTAEVNTYEEMKQTLRAYFEANGTPGQGNHHHGPRPQINFVYPISVISQDGEIITVNNQTELEELRANCAGTFDNHDHHGHGQHGLSCFEIVFPITLKFPDGTTATAADREALHQLIRTWKANNPGVQGRPEFAFPLTVKMTEDGSLVTVNSADELRALKENCE